MIMTLTEGLMTIGFATHATVIITTGNRYSGPDMITEIITDGIKIRDITEMTVAGEEGTAVKIIMAEVMEEDMIETMINHIKKYRPAIQQAGIFLCLI